MVKGQAEKLASCIAYCIRLSNRSGYNATTTQHLWNAMHSLITEDGGSKTATKGEHGDPIDMPASTLLHGVGESEAKMKRRRTISLSICLGFSECGQTVSHSEGTTNLQLHHSRRPQQTWPEVTEAGVHQADSVPSVAAWGTAVQACPEVCDNTAQTTMDMISRPVFEAIMEDVTKQMDSVRVLMKDLTGTAAQPGDANTQQQTQGLQHATAASSTSTSSTPIGLAELRVQHQANRMELMRQRRQMRALMKSGEAEDLT